LATADVDGPSTENLSPEQQRLIALYKSGAQDQALPSSSTVQQQAEGRQLSAAELSEVYRRNRQGLEDCYNRALKRDDTLKSFKIEVELLLGASGVVKGIKLDAGEPTLTDCLKRAIRRWVFQPLGAETSISFPLVFAGS